MKLLYYFLSLHCTLWKKLIVCRSPARSEQLLSTSTKGAYIPKLFGIFLYMRFVSSPALIYIFNHRYQYGLDIYTLGYNPIPQFHFLLILSQHGPLAALSVGSWVHLTFLHGWGGEVSCFVLFLITSLLPSTIRHSRLMSYSRLSYFFKKFWFLLLKSDITSLSLFFLKKI